MDGFYKGRRVQEYRTMGDFTKGQNFVQHLLPHPWAGTGHVVYNGSLYYNKHQSNILVGGLSVWPRLNSGSASFQGCVLRRPNSSSEDASFEGHKPASREPNQTV